MSVIQAQDIVNAVIQDSQVQTTNRTALYDYTDRIHQRILRESQWRFLLSDPQTFVTMPGVSSYTLVSGTPPAGSFQTANQLANFGNLAPDSLFNMSTFTQLREDSDTQTTLSSMIHQDGSLRYGPPRTYSNSLSNAGTILLKPVPDSQNSYYPVPETPEITFVAGGTLPARIYYGVVTFVDSLNGESTQCNIPFTAAIPSGYLIVVNSPNPVPSGVSGNQAVYGWWNVYAGYSLGTYNRQNGSPIAIGTNWTESTLGINTGTLQVPSAVYLPPTSSNAVLSITPTGFLGTTILSGPVLPSFWAIEDSSSNLWQLTVDGSGFLHTYPVAPNPAALNVYSAIYLTDTSNVATWAITITTGGVLQSTVYSNPPTTASVNGQPPKTSTLQPLNAYVIQFRYYQTRNKITNPTDVLQIPYAYKDIVIAGVNYYASLYLDRSEAREPAAKTNIWKRDFDQGLAQIRRDLRINFRKTDFISPDPVSQATVGNRQGIPTMGW